MSMPDLIVRGGRVIDPESGRDEIADVAVSGDRVIDIGNELAPAPVELDAAGHVVTAGFIDLHSHVNGVAGLRLQAMDGVTTALELEAGVTPVDAAYRQAAAEGRPVNFGFATSWALARMEAVAGVKLDGRLSTFLDNIARPEWQRSATPAQVGAVLDRLAADLADGAIGIGVLIGYAPGSDPAEYLQMAGVAAAAGAPTFTHARDLIEMVPGTAIDGAEEIVRAAAETGAQMHYCHVNSTSNRHADRVLDLVGSRAAGGRPRVHRGLPVRLGHDRDRRRVPGPGAAGRARADPAVAHVRSDRRARRERRAGSASCARPTPAAWSSSGSSTRTTRPTGSCCCGR